MLPFMNGVQEGITHLNSQRIHTLMFIWATSTHSTIFGSIALVPSTSWCQIYMIRQGASWVDRFVAPSLICYYTFMLRSWPYFIFSAHLFCAFSHSFPTHSLMRHSDRHLITWQVTWWIIWLIRSHLSHAITLQSAALRSIIIYPFTDCQLMICYS